MYHVQAKKSEKLCTMWKNRNEKGVQAEGQAYLLRYNRWGRRGRENYYLINSKKQDFFRNKVKNKGGQIPPKTKKAIPYLLQMWITYK